MQSTMTEERTTIHPPFENVDNIYRLAEELKMQERRVIDFSVSVNPMGVSKKVKADLRKHLKYLHHYPDPEAERLRKRLAQYFAIDPETVLCGNGSTELLYLIPRVLHPAHVLIPAPTCPEYERACRIHSETRISYFELKEEDGFHLDADRFIDAMPEGGISELYTPNISSPCAMAFLCNPNNPTGRLLSRHEIVKIGEAARDRKCYLVVDEAFIDFCSDGSVIKNAAGNPFLIVLRSMSHFYSLAGLRIGYGIFSQHLVRRLRGHREPWAVVNSLAQRAAVTALKDKVYRKETTVLMAEEKRFIEKHFRKLGIEFIPSDANYYLLKMRNAGEIARALKKRGILVRECTDVKGLGNPYLGIAVKSRRENAVLMRELAGILNDR
jgi:threonine-phosphate decarboxylase